MPIFGQKWPFFQIFFSTKNAYKFFKTKENSLKCDFFLISGLLGNFFVGKFLVKNLSKVRITPYQNAIFGKKWLYFGKFFSTVKRLQMPNDSGWPYFCPIFRINIFDKKETIQDIKLFLF